MSPDFTEEELRFINMAKLITTCSSLAGQAFMLFSLFTKIKTQTLPMRLITSLVISSVVYSVGDLLTYFNHQIEAFCMAEGYLQSMGMVSCALWCLIILYVSARQITDYHKTFEAIYNKLLFLNILFSIIPSAITYFVYISVENDYLRNDGGACTEVPESYMVLISDGFLFLLILVIFYTSFRVIFRVQNKYQNNDVQEYKTMLAYPVCLAIFWIPDFISHVVTIVEKDPKFILIMIQICTTRSLGLINALVFVIIGCIHAHNHSKVARRSSDIIVKSLKDNFELTVKGMTFDDYGSSRTQSNTLQELKESLNL